MKRHALAGWQFDIKAQFATHGFDVPFKCGDFQQHFAFIAVC
jgi:hypothetical protein